LSAHQALAIFQTSAPLCPFQNIQNLCSLSDIFIHQTIPLGNSMNKEVTMQLPGLTFNPALNLSAGNGGEKVI